MTDDESAYLLDSVGGWSMATESERKMLAHHLGGLTKPALRALCIRYGSGAASRVRLWSKRKDELIEDILAHADQLLRGFEARTHAAEPTATRERGQAEIGAGAAGLKQHIQAERRELEAFLKSKIQVGKGEWLVHFSGSWASILGLVLALGILLWSRPVAMYRLKIYVLDEDGGHAAGASVKAPPWQVAPAEDHWLLAIPLEELPPGGTLVVTARKGEGFVKEKVQLVPHRGSVTLRLRYPNALITGVILSPTGEPVAGASIKVFNYEHEEVFSAEDGSFSVPAHAPAGTEARLIISKGDWGRNTRFIAGIHHEIGLTERKAK